VIRRGRDYGWPNVEGGDGPGPYADPFVTWSPTSTCSPSGLAIAKGRAWVGALAGEALFSVKLRGRNAGRKVRHFHGRFGRIRAVQQAPDGTLWITTSNGSNDRVIRIHTGG
jgi:glucose/arabinose dehydrogenase